MNIEDQLSNLLDDREFQEIDARFRRFNLFEAVGAVRAELRHSNFLAFLLSPSRPHGLGVDILTRLLRAFVAKLPREKRPIGILDLLVGNLDAAIVERERNNIDIFIEVKPLKLAVVIENKVDSLVSEGQLVRYRQFVQHRFPDWRKLFVLLTPDGERPDDPNYDDPEYLTFSYSALADLIAKYAEERHSAISSDIALILDNYVDTLRRFIVEDAELQEKARQLYFRYKEAFDFILTIKPPPENALDPVRAVIEESAQFAFDRRAPRLIRFVPAEWESLQELNSCPKDRWTRTGRSLLFELSAHRSSDRININLVLGPAGPEFREYLYSWASKNLSVFVGLVKPMGLRTSTIYGHDLLTAAAAQEMDEEQKAGALLDEWRKFTELHLPMLKASVDEAVRLWREKDRLSQ